MFDYELIDPETERTRIEKDKARDLERMAVMAEMEADQYGRTVDLSPDHPTARNSKTQAQDTARTQRHVAGNAHRIAGTSPAEFAASLIPDIRSRLQAMETQHLFYAVQLEHAEDYGLDPVGTAQSLKEIEAGILAMRSKVEELQASADTHEPDEDAAPPE